MGLRCLLTSVNCVQLPYPVYPLGMAHVAGALREQGHEVRQLDLLAGGANYPAALEAELENFQPHLTGISIRNLDLEDSSRPRGSLSHVEKIAEVIRARGKDTVLVLGGPAFSLAPEKIMQLLKADYGVVGEGEQAVVELAADLEAGRPPRGPLLRSAPGAAPWRSVAYDPKISPFYLAAGGMLNIQTKRGCPHGCVYCSYPLLEGRKIRGREPEQVADEAIRLRDEFKAEYLFFTDSVFNDHQGHYLQVCEALIRRGNTLPWMAYFRPAGLDRAALRLMKRAGLDAMEIGTDGGCDEILAGLGKNFSFADAARLNQLAVEQQIPCAHFFMFGGPGENSDTLCRSLANIETLRPSVAFAFNGIRILPGTGIHKLAIEQNLVNADDDLLEPRFYFSPQITAQQIDQTLRTAWRGRPDRQYQSREMEERVKLFHAKGFTGPVWDRIARLGFGR